MRGRPVSRKYAPLGRRMIAAAGALTLAVAGVVASGTATFAEDPAYGTINQDATGSIIVHKHLKNASGTMGKVDGTADAEGDGIDGVTFKAYKVSGLNLSKPADWDKLATLVDKIPSNACADPAHPTLGDNAPAVDTQAAATGTTADGGKTTLAGLPVAAYLVCETEAPANIVEKAKPFVVTIPFPNTTNGGDGKWLYDVHAYPKNQKIEIDKTISDQRKNGVGLGSRVQFPVSTTIPSLDADTNFTYFYIRDRLDDRLADGKVDKITLGTDTLVENTDYVQSNTGGLVLVSFQRAGLAKLKANPGKKVEAIFSGVVSAIGDGTIKNQAQLIQDTNYGAIPPNEPPSTPPTEPNDPPTSPEVSTDWGNAQLLKFDANADPARTGIQGAKFKVYDAAEPYAADCSAATKTGEPITVNNKTEFVSDANGLVTIDGLYVGDSVGSAGAGSQDARTRCYVVEEVEAPAGYVLPQKTTTGISVSKGVLAAITYSAEIPNNKQPVPQLPLTGANGQLLMTIGGLSLGLIAVGSTMVIRSRKRSEA